MLKKTVAELAAVREYSSRLEEEVSAWRSGGVVDKDQWVPSLPASGAKAESSKRVAGMMSPPPASGISTPSRMGTPGGIPLMSPFQSDSRPDTPTVYSLPLDEKEEFLRRENELSDQLAEKVCPERYAEESSADR